MWLPITFCLAQHRLAYGSRSNDQNCTSTNSQQSRINKPSHFRTGDVNRLTNVASRIIIATNMHPAFSETRGKNCARKAAPIPSASRRLAGCATTKTYIRGWSHQLLSFSRQSPSLPLNKHRQIFRCWVGFTNQNIPPSLSLVASGQ
jgi:hypothetical protein